MGNVQQFLLSPLETLGGDVAYYTGSVLCCAVLCVIHHVLC